mmetsp:Transcript_44696/g.76009  ORF Transcript_44696/g.76009 Transcript_44696/m.76009 type:complete len:116 (+) Transcript_44696:41-388(+)
MPSKPPISGAKKKANQVARRLPGNIVKRMKRKAVRAKQEDERWAQVMKKRKISASKDGDDEPINDLREVPSVQQAPSISHNGKNKKQKRITNRALKASLRETIQLLSETTNGGSR